MNWEIILSAGIGYLLGAIPFALLLVKLFAEIDVRKSGTGNVGAMNSYDVTGKKWLGVSVMILDLAKGFFAPFIADLISNGDIFAVSMAASFVILGHNYNIFLSFRGGRGLASAAGASLYINFLPLAIWLLIFALIYFLIKKNLHIASIFAMIAIPLIIFILPENLVSAFHVFTAIEKDELIYLMLFVTALVLSRHVQPILDLIEKDDQNTFSRK